MLSPVAESPVDDTLAAARHELEQLHGELEALSQQVDLAKRSYDDLLSRRQADNEVRARIAAIPTARLLSNAIDLEGSAADRLRVRRLRAGRTIERPFAQFMGVTSCVTAAPDVRELWDRLLDFERDSDDTLRGFPAAVLDVPQARLAAENGRLRITFAAPVEAMTTPESNRLGEVAVPRFAFQYAVRKMRNFGHWLLDCVPQVVALRAIAPGATLVVPEPVLGFHRSTLAAAGLPDSQLYPWDGRPLIALRALVLESDGRAGGGRPLSSLIELRRLLGAQALPLPSDGRRLFVSRRDAKAKRQWISNESEVEDLFRRYGFEIVSMAGQSLEEQRRMFAEATIVAGGSGAGLADIMFAPPGAHVIVLVSDSLVRWYAEEEGSRSRWAGAARGRGKELAALGDSPRFYAHLAAAFEQTCHTFVAPDTMPIPALSAFLDTVLAKAPVSCTR